MDLSAQALRVCLKNPHSALKAPLPPSLSPSVRRRLIRGLSLTQGWTDALLPPSFFQGCGLRVLSFASCSKVSAGFVLQVLAHCGSELLGLDLTSMFALDDAALGGVLRACPHLRYLCVVDCRKLTDASLAAMVDSGASLRHIDIGGCACLSGAGVKRLVERHPGIRQFVGLGLSGVEGADGELAAALAAKCTRLQRLALGYYMGYTAPLVEVLRVNADSLVALELHWTRAATDDLALVLTGSLGNMFKELRLLNLQGAKAMSLDGLCAIVNTHPRRQGAALPEWDASDTLEWRTFAGLPKKTLQEVLALSACVSSAPAGEGSSSSGSGASSSSSSSSAAMEEDGEEDATPSLLRKLGPGLAHLCCKFGTADGAPLAPLRDHCQKLVQAGTQGPILID